MPKSNADLFRMFNEFNRKFFNGRKPKYRVAFSARLRARGWCYTERRTILISARLAGDEIRRTLLHEMCHIGSPGHGKHWQARLLKLAEQGETWAADEAKSYSELLPFSVNAADIRGTITDWAYSPDANFSVALRQLASEQGLTNKEFLRRYPWVKAAWKKERLAARAEERRRKKRSVD